uniref:Putative sulfotransferase n=1 Tax=Rhipicephalus pulchellus TaxID=72859 RepID=L7LWJ3_RHIPC
MPRPGAIKTHLPYHLQPMSPEAKYIYVTRNPYDCCVSFYHHTRSFPAYRFAQEPFDKFFDMFVEGKVDFGDYFDHQISWYDHRNDDNVLVITYEELKMNPRAGILKIADFLGESHGKKLREQPEVLERILNTTSLNTMKGFNDEFKKWTEKATDIIGQTGKTIPMSPEVAEDMKKPMTGDFVRKGIIGDWKNHFTPDQIRRMKERIAEKTKDSTVMSLWDGVDLP